MYSNSHKYLARYSSPSSRPRRRATLWDHVATLYACFSEIHTENQVHIQSHLAFVEPLLRMRSTKHLDETQRQMRELLLDLLLVYANSRSVRGGLDKEQKSSSNGVDGPVGFLLANTAGMEMARSICSAHEAAPIEHSQRAKFEAWVQASGLSMDELAMIQPDIASSARRAPVSGIHPLFQRLKSASQNRMKDYLDRAFIGTRMGVPAPEREGAALASRGITIAGFLAPFTGNSAQDFAESALDPALGSNSSISRSF